MRCWVYARRSCAVSAVIAVMAIGACKLKENDSRMGSILEPTVTNREDYAKITAKGGESSKAPVGLFKGATKPLPTPNKLTVTKPRALQMTAMSASSVAQVTDPLLDAKLLVIAADGSEYELPAIQKALDILGTPYTLLKLSSLTPDSAGNRLSASLFYSGNHSYYQGVILSNNVLNNVMTAADWQTLWDYETAFQLRQVTWYTFPTEELGFDVNAGLTSADTTTTPLALNLVSPAGTSVFFDVNSTAGSILLKYSWVYFAKALGDGASQTVLSDSSNNALGLIRTYPDGRQNLALTFASSTYVFHAQQLAYGLINWVTKGIFLGERHAYLAAQVDDYFIAADIYGGGTYRMNGADLTAHLNWQNKLRANTPAKTFRLDLAFNGAGYVAGTTDSLSAQAKAQQANFRWINHTYEHVNLDTGTAAEIETEIAKNMTVASNIGLTNFSRVNFVSPDISGLNNTTAMGLFQKYGIRYLVSDTSRVGQNNPTPNTGIPSPLDPYILQIPRHPVNIFWDVSTPAEETTEYNDIYRAYWGRDLTYTEILDTESDFLLSYLMNWDIDPLMFHQANLRAYNGVNSLLGDVIDAALVKYKARMTLPVLSLSEDEIGRRMAARAAYNASRVSATIRPGISMTLSVQSAATIPITGVSSTGFDNYGGQMIARAYVTPASTVTVSLTDLAQKLPKALDSSLVGAQNQTLTTGKSLKAIGMGTGCEFDAIMEGDGSYDIYQGSKRLWTTATIASPGARLVFNSSGNLAVYRTNNTIAWQSATTGLGGTLATVIGDGRMVITKADGTQVWKNTTPAANCAIWADPTVPAACKSRLNKGEELRYNQYLCNGPYKFIMQTDGNAVVYNGSTPKYSLGTTGKAGVRLTFQSDGNFVMYKNNDVPVWSSGTYLYPATGVILQADGNVVILNEANNKTCWSIATKRLTSCR